jgi:hypothetical protein
VLERSEPFPFCSEYQQHRPINVLRANSRFTRVFGMQYQARQVKNAGFHFVIFDGT